MPPATPATFRSYSLRPWRRQWRVLRYGLFGPGVRVSGPARVVQLQADWTRRAKG